MVVTAAIVTTSAAAETAAAFCALGRSVPATKRDTPNPTTKPAISPSIPHAATTKLGAPSKAFTSYHFTPRFAADPAANRPINPVRAATASE